jgi:electron transport complex protein RnfD
MLWVSAALLPATLFGFWLYGWPAIHLWWITTASAILGEAFCLRLRQEPVAPTLRDGSALLTGWLLALSLPPWAPWWVGVVGGLFATVIGKQVFGGLGQNLFNPAMVARVMLLISFPVPMTLGRRQCRCSRRTRRDLSMACASPSARCRQRSTR